MTKKYTVLSIDDDKFIHKVIAKTLNPEYETIFAQTGEEGINLARLHKPDIIITDVEMPGLNGYEVCEKLKTEPSTAHIPVIFLSSLDSLQQRLSGFEAGAEDYLVKPFDAEKLLNKIAGLTRYVEDKIKTQEKITVAENTAYLALTGSSELGLAMQLIEQSYNTNSIEDLANLLLTFTKNKALDCTIRFSTNQTPTYLTAKGVPSPLEIDLIELLRAEQNRFHDFGCRTQINFPNISLLIKNMPLGNPEEYGRIKDSFPPILASYDAKIKAINTESVIREQSIILNESFNKIKDTLEKIGSSLHENSQSSYMLMSAMLDELNMKLPSMALEDDQEEYILKRIETAVESSRKAFSDGEEINSSFTSVITQLHTLVEQQNKLLDASVRIQKDNEVKIEKKLGGSDSMDIELF